MFNLWPDGVSLFIFAEIFQSVFTETFWSFFSKPVITVFTGLYFQAFWAKWPFSDRNELFLVISKTFRSVIGKWKKKTQMLTMWQFVYILPYSLNTTTAFYFVTECSNFAVFVRLRVCMSQCTRTLAGLDQFRN